ncbi:unnamed protein product [Ambrosiozyma monospora]|uniref:Unnamed protein product n=1 Tax=Ambrosiozyma monospora TaxID=43982 RepID=A0ACB5U9Y8_AMBMO|nr:unnamed protein product [Ambrosiozyma monospora]
MKFSVAVLVACCASTSFAAAVPFDVMDSISDFFSNWSSDSDSSSSDSTSGASLSTSADSSSESGSSSTSSAATSSGSSSATSTGSKHSGRGTYYSVGADNCGTSSSDSDYVCAISHSLYETAVGSDDVSSYCGKKINVSYGGKSITVTVVDSCESCGDDDLDFSPTAFSALADESVGELNIEWYWAS